MHHLVTLAVLAALCVACQGASEGKYGSEWLAKQAAKHIGGTYEGITGDQFDTQWEALSSTNDINPMTDGAIASETLKQKRSAFAKKTIDQLVARIEKRGISVWTQASPEERKLGDHIKKKINTMYDQALTTYFAQAFLKFNEHGSEKFRDISNEVDRKVDAVSGWERMMREMTDEPKPLSELGKLRKRVQNAVSDARTTPQVYLALTKELNQKKHNGWQKRLELESQPARPLTIRVLKPLFQQFLDANPE